MTITRHHARRLATVVVASLILGLGAANAVSAAGTNRAHPTTPLTTQATTAWLAQQK